MRRIEYEFLILLTIVGVLAFSSHVAAADARDAEAATHDDEAAAYQLIDTYDFPGFKLAQFDLAVLSHFSYMLFSGDECLVIDPGRDILTYVETAKKENAKIVGVWLTHSHADFVAGHIEFAGRLGIPLRISQQAEATYEHIGLKDGDSMVVGDCVIKFLATPGHTPDSMCGVVAGKQAPDEPLALLTGDTLFIGSVGRPDLLGEGMAASTLASMMFDTWTKKLSKLPDEVIVLPAHGSGSLCGAHLSDDPVSTIGEQRRSNPYLQYTNRGEFVAAILEELPQAPQYFAHNAAMNKAGPKPVNWQLDALPSVPATADLTDASKYYVVDVRSAEEYAVGHIPNSVNVALRGRFETWTGIMVPWDAQTVLTGSDKDLREGIFRLHRVGYEPRCILFEEWKRSGFPMTKNDMITPKQLHDQMKTPEAPVIVDVRQPAEWEELRLGTVLNMPLRKLSDDAVKLDKSQHIVAVCNSAYRSSLAVGVLERKGFGRVSSMAGGGDAWVEQGLPVLESSRGGVVGAASTMGFRLAERISAAALKRQIMDLPDTIVLMDIRPPAQFADYHLPGSVNVDISDLLANPSYLTGVGALVIIDRDGSLAMMVAGIISQKTDRPIKALFGGLQAYWDEAGPGAAAGSRGSMVPPLGATRRAVGARGAPSGRPSNVPKKKRRRSAGC